MNALEKLKEFSTVVADTSEFRLIDEYKPTDATTNPSLVLRAAKAPQYKSIIEEIVNDVGSMKQCPLECMIAQALEKVVVRFGVEILRIIPGRVSTEVDARLAFDVHKQISAAKRVIDDYAEKGIDKSRILIKLPSTWEGIQAAKVLQQAPYSINCNLTLLFSLIQAQACGEADVTLISPFVGRILDWYKKEKSGEVGIGTNDPGVKNVYKIFELYKKKGFKTQVMGASFRNVEEILALAGIDLLTISPDLMEKLKSMGADVVQKRLSRNDSATSSCEVDAFPSPIDEANFRWHLNQDQMATDKLSEGIRNFAADTIKLEEMLREMFAKNK